MNDSADFLAYLNLANDIFNGQISEYAVPDVVSQLPPLNEVLLSQLAQYAEEISLSEPRRSWAIALLADHAARDCSLQMQSRAAWYLGRACNHWGQPKRVTDAVLRARKGFEDLNEPGWIAACDWQLNYLAWTKPNFGETVRQLKAALDGLERAGFDAFAPDCRLTLAYAQILTWDFDGAKENIETCHAFFVSRQDPINQARCWLNDANWLRRQSDFDRAYIKLEQALETFELWNAPIDVAKTHYQIGLWYFLSENSYQKAVEHFEKAGNVFFEHGLDMWYAVCQNGLAQINLQNGNLSKADINFQTAREIFIAHNISGLTADNNNDRGQLELMRGNLPKSLEYFQEAEKINETIGSELAAAIALANQGNLSALLGRFQDALSDLELAQKRFLKLNNPDRLAGGEIYLSKIWADLNQYTTAHECLNRAETLIRPLTRPAMLEMIYNQRAAIFSLEGKVDQAISALKSGLEISREFEITPRMALSERQLGEMLSQAGQSDEALALIISAETKFSQMGMVIEQAASLTSLGYHYIQVSASEEAETVFQKALDTCRGIMPDIESRIYTGRAMLAEGRNDFVAALENYREAVKLMMKLRHSFWQPALAGSYLLRSSSRMDKSVELACKLHAHDDALMFIESSKAQSLAKQISAPILRLTSDIPIEIQDLSFEIQTLQMQLRATHDPNAQVQSFERMKETRQKLVERAQRYDEQLAKLERETASREMPLQHSEFDLVRFKNHANALFGKDWLALDYYITRTALSCVMITPDNNIAWEKRISKREQMVLDVCAKSHRGAFSLSSDDMKLLGDLLLPVEMQKHVSPVTSLMIAPNRSLHSVPWSALEPGWADRALVEICIPIVVPSLQLLQLTWQRTGQNQVPTRTTGLLLGISDFQGVRPQLQLVLNEIGAISQKTNADSAILINTQATWNRLTSLCDTSSDTKNGLSRFAFFHIASHVNHDSRTGRLSNIVLHDGEVLLDQLRNLAPLPNLVTLSACNGTQSLVCEGDEHVGLATTCLTAGANTVVGSLWPVLDLAAASIMTDFYNGFFAGFSPSQALAHAQRTAIKNGEGFQNWASFICLGS